MRLIFVEITQKRLTQFVAVMLTLMLCAFHVNYFCILVKNDHSIIDDYKLNNILSRNVVLIFFINLVYLLNAVGLIDLISYNWLLSKKAWCMDYFDYNKYSDETYCAIYHRLVDNTYHYDNLIKLKVMFLLTFLLSFLYKGTLFVTHIVVQWNSVSAFNPS